ncbi:MAG: adenylyltransferase/cytidyltransferase family protein [Leptospiraceae bacterium]|nr:adenylyltransferase/cytidyltransferase family protein [Leptospiraceae bacterium]
MTSISGDVTASIFHDRNRLKSVLDHQSFQSVVFTNGCFDVLHRGHAAYLAQARALGDCLVVGLNSDASVRALKGADRPIHTWEDRAWLLACLRFVDFVVFFNEATPIETLQVLRPSIHCKGGDYQPADLPEKPTIDSFGGRIEILPFLGGHSTTNILRKGGRIQV